MAITNKKKILFFPGKNTPLKRYVSYFPSLELVTFIDEPTTILCHSRGLDNAIKYCTENNIKPLIVSMDGVEVNIPNNLDVISFRPEHKQTLGDEYMYQKNIYYNIKQTHHPYMDRNVRDMIVKELNP